MRKLFILLTMSLCFTWQLKAADYYWVGGSGNWSDFANHWATSSGGGTFHLQVPRTTDNLFFDANSFTAPGQIINIDTTIISCLNMDWTGVVNNPTLTSISSASLKIYGSLKLVPGMTFNSIPFTGVGFVFESTTPGKMITTGGKTLSQITFSGEGGGWTLQDGLAVAGDIRFNAGSLDMNSKPVSANTFTTGGSVGILPRTLTMGTMTFTGKWDIFNFTGNLTVSAASSTIITSGFRGAGFVYNDVLFPNGGSIFDGGNTFHNVSFGFTGSTIGNNTFNDLTFSRDGSISGNNTINNLTFLPGFTYSLGAGNTQTINSLTATGNCNQFITIKSNSPGIQAIISKASGTITLSYINLQDIKATGGATFIANNSIATGNNTGWTINGQAPRDLYWVGGSGNWNDGNHWSLSSGGSPLGCSPTFLDNVFFDVNSFPSSGQSVNINTPIVSCVNMDWTGVTNNPALTSMPFALLKISGSLKLVPGMTINSIPFTGVGFEFTSTTTGKTITTGGKTLSQITFSGEGGGWTLQDGLTVDGSISFNAGSLDMNSKPVSANTFTTGGGAGILPRTLIMGTMTFTGRWDIFNFIGNLTVSAASSTIKTSGFRGGGFVYNDVLFPNGGTIIDGGNTFDIVSFGFTGSTIGNNTFNDLTFSGDGSISGNNTINNLTFSPGFTYSLGAGNTQTINSLNATGNCNQFITIRSNGAGTQAILSKASGTVTLSYINLQDIKATGGATFIANNSIGTGNNTGWIINGQTPRDLYWVGGSGNWDDGNHWSLSSGGSPLGCSPTFLDNVFFDVNSFPSSGQSVNINSPIVSCVNMDWTGVVNNPAFTSIPFASLKISGSLKLEPGMTINSIPFNGVGFEFTSTTTGKTLTTGGKTLSQITFSGEGGGWTLQDGLTVDGSISFNAGSLDMNSKPVSANTFTTGGGAGILPRTLIMGTMTFTGRWDIFNFIGNLTVSAASSTIKTSGFRGGGFVYNDVLFPNGGTIIDGGNTFDIVSFGFTGSTIGNNTFNDLTFSGDGSISGNNTINNLTFSPGFTYSLGAGNTQTINSLNATGNCNQFITIKSNSPGIQAIISKASGTITLSYINLQDIKATGGATFIANNSIGTGNNTGWIINAQTPRDLYWVGGSGNWDDGNHWSLSSGGSPLGCSPTFLDNVFFDVNSFPSSGQSVNINSPI